MSHYYTNDPVERARNEHQKAVLDFYRTSGVPAGDLYYRDTRKLQEGTGLGERTIRRYEREGAPVLYLLAIIGLGRVLKGEAKLPDLPDPTPKPKPKKKSKKRRKKRS